MKILIGCPTCSRYRYCIDKWLFRVNEIINNSKEHKIDYLLVDNSKDDDFFNELKDKDVNIIKSPHLENIKETISESRNLLREKVIKENYDYFFSLEQDVIPPLDILRKLLSHGKDIISPYFQKPILVGLKDKETGEVHNAVLEFALVWLQEDPGIKRALPQQVKGKGLMKVGGLGIGCMLIKKQVLEKIKFKFEENKKAFDDILFCLDSKELGYDLFVDSDIINVEHLHIPWNKAIKY
tara:strand:+ start:57 stop:773 length:717 start_codon:yes stop_codon:yes gene_type:complete